MIISVYDIPINIVSVADIEFFLPISVCTDIATKPYTIC